MRASESKRENLKRVLESIERVDADLHAFPEYLMGVGERGISRKYVRELAEPIDGEFAISILEKTGEVGVAAVFTLFMREGESVYNAAVLADGGRVRAVYKKIHLFDAYGYRESRLFEPGRELAISDVGGFRVGLAVCFDLRFPELFRAMAYRGVDVFVVPSAWYRGSYKLDQWRALALARAHENTAYLVAVDQTGRLFLGHSMIASPLGYLELDLGEGERSAVFEIGRGEIEEARRLVPWPELARKDLYREWI